MALTNKDIKDLVQLGNDWVEYRRRGEFGFGAITHVKTSSFMVKTYLTMGEVHGFFLIGDPNGRPVALEIKDGKIDRLEMSIPMVLAGIKDLIQEGCQALENIDD